MTQPADTIAGGANRVSSDGPAFAPHPPAGRVFTASRAVRSTDVTPDGRLRLDALARYLQEAAADDVADAGLAEPYVWLVRRVAVAVRGYPSSSTTAPSCPAIIRGSW